MGFILFSLYVSIAIFAKLKLTDSAGVIQIKLISYQNTFGWKSGNRNQCCDVMSSDVLQCSTQPCDPYFDICLQNMTHSGCGLGRQVTGYTRDQDNIAFGDTIGHNNTGNPLKFPVSQFFDNQMTVMITAYDEDKTEGNLKLTNDKIDYMQQIISYTPDFNGTHKTTLNFTLTGKVSSLIIQVNVRCGTFYYGNSCTKRCRSDKRTYACDSNGDKTCLPGWTGATCGTNVDECVNNSCQNGATCKDDINKYICECPANFTGRYCESMITTSTQALSTTTSTKGTTVTSTITSSTVTTTLPVTTSSSSTANSVTSTSETTTTNSLVTNQTETTTTTISTPKTAVSSASPRSSRQPTQTTATVTKYSTRNNNNAVSPKASHLGQKKMSDPESSGGSPGPLIGGVFGGLVVLAGSVVVGFFVYKRKREKMQQPVKNRRENPTSPGARSSGDGKSVHDATDGDAKIDIEDRSHTQDTPKNTNFAKELSAIDF